MSLAIPSEAQLKTEALVLEVNQPLFKKRTSKKPPQIRKRPATPPSDAESSSTYSSDSDAGVRVKRRRKIPGAIGSSSNGVDKGGKSAATATAKRPENSIEASSTKYAADRSGQITSTNDATRQSNWYDEQQQQRLGGDADARGGTSGTGNLGPAPGTILTPLDGDGNYKGTAQYQSFIQKSVNAPSRQVGPIKAPTNIRTITVTDFAPDVCKDYKQTGFCGFGDSCKFLHAREDYKQGWELDKDWEIGTKGKRVQGTKVSGRKGEERAGPEDVNDDDDEDMKLEGIPFACNICKKPYVNPIITKCGHYFCESCALQRYRKSPACAACGAGTGGVFNGAKGLKKLLDKKRERAERRRENAIANGEEVTDDEDDGQGGGGED